MPDDFDWKPENEDVILPEQRTTAVYVNRWGQAVIRQEKAWDEEDDTFVIIGHANIPAVIAALQEIAARPVDRDDAPPPHRRSQTPVERAAAGDVVVLNDHVAERARGEHSRATE